MTFDSATVTKIGVAVTSVVTALVVLNVVSTDKAGAIITAIGAVVSAVTAFLTGLRTDNAEARAAKEQLASLTGSTEAP